MWLKVVRLDHDTLAAAAWCSAAVISALRRDGRIVHDGEAALRWCREHNEAPIWRWHTLSEMRLAE